LLDAEAQVVVGNMDVGCAAAIGERLCSLQEIPLADMEDTKKQVANSV